jgi:hypothetical protein
VGVSEELMKCLSYLFRASVSGMYVRIILKINKMLMLSLSISKQIKMTASVLDISIYEMPKYENHERKTESLAPLSINTAYCSSELSV